MWCVCVTEGIVTEGPLPISYGQGETPSPYPMPNPLDERAVEMAAALRERHGGKVVLLSVGSITETVLRDYLGLGADEAICIDEGGLDGLNAEQVAWVLARVVEQLAPQTVFCGARVANGHGSGMVPFALAAFLGWPVVPEAAVIRVEGKTLVAERVIERGDREVLQAAMPCVVTVAETAGLTRYPAVARANRARVRRSTLADWGISWDDVRAASWGGVEVRRVKARPRPRKLYVPPSTLSAADRLAALLQGGARPSRGGRDARFFEGPPEEAARVILDFLTEEKLLR